MIATNIVPPRQAKSHPKYPAAKGTDITRWLRQNLCGRSHKVENMLGKLEDWRHINTRFDRCAYTFLPAIAIPATVIFWLS